ncbi:MAG TPA: SGNH/GDSL hydrolase family protein [Terriglobia bacterium]|nr:SGNH/GDSL hydrolase family protein [Terriglobia bacterium]
MINAWLNSKSGWRDAVLVLVTLIGLAGFEKAALIVYTTPLGRYPAMMLEVMRSAVRNPGNAGYYERLFRGTGEVAPDPRYIHDNSFRVYRLRPNLEQKVTGWTTNSFGLIGRECSLHRPPHTRRVALLGDSITAGFGLDDPNRTFGGLLEDRLNATKAMPERLEILNFAVTGYHLTQILDVTAEDVPRFEPDVYMLALTELSVFRNWDEHLVQLIQLGIDPKYDFLRETVRRAGVSRKDDSVLMYAKLAPFRLPVLRELLGEMKSHADHAHAPFLVLLVPTAEEGDLSKKRFDGIPELLALRHIRFIDLLDTFDNIADMDAFRISSTDVHPNERGHAMIFENLYAKLRARPDAWADLVGESAVREATDVNRRAAF